MTYTPPDHLPYQWQNAPSTSTPLDAAHLEAAEQDIVTWTKGALSDLATGVGDGRVTLPTATVNSLTLTANVKLSYGAKGDGVTDDTAAIKAAIDATRAAGGGLVYLPKGTYISDQQSHPANVTFQGEGYMVTILKLKNSANKDLLVSDGFSANTGTSNIGTINQALKDLTLDANRANQTSKARCWAHYGYNPVVENVRFINGYGGGVYSEWGGADSSQPMEGQWRNWKIWNYGGTPGSVGLDWNGPHDSQLGGGIIATLDTTIQPTDATYGATPINGSTLTIPTNNGNGGAGTFTFATTSAAPTTLYPTSGGSFVVKTSNSLETWGIINYTSANTVSSVTTFSGCTCSLASNRTLISGDGIVVPTYGLRVNGGSGTHGESALAIDNVHIWGRNHFGVFPNSVPVFASNATVEGAFITNVVLTSKSRFAGQVYGTNGQAGQTNESGVQIGTTDGGCAAARVDAVVYNVGGASSANGCSAQTVNSSGQNVIRCCGTTSHATKYVGAYSGSPDRWEAYCQNHPTFSVNADYSPTAEKISQRQGVINFVSTSGGSAVTPDASAGDNQFITVSSTNAFTINAATHPPDGASTQILTIEVWNNSGSAIGTITWNAIYVFAGLSWTNPASNKVRAAMFRWNGYEWVCFSVTSADYS